MGTVLVVGAGPQRARLIDKGLDGMLVHVVHKRWATFLHARRSSAPALVIYDLAGTGAPQADILATLPGGMPDTGVLYLGGPGRSDLEELTQALRHPNVDFILQPDDTRELRLRADRLLARGIADGGDVTARRPGLATPDALRHTVPQLHAPNGRLDAGAVSALFGISLAALARALGRAEQTVHKTPAAPAIQPALRLYERIAALLLHLTGSEAGLRAWMNAGNPELEDGAPMTLLLHGEGDVVAELLEDAMIGAPS
jgi:hypothetical protein